MFKNKLKKIFRNTGVEHFLVKIADKLPDTEFVLNTRDWPQTTTWQPNKLPIFSFSKVVTFLRVLFFKKGAMIYNLIINKFKKRPHNTATSCIRRGRFGRADRPCGPFTRTGWADGTNK